MRCKHAREQENKVGGCRQGAVLRVSHRPVWVCRCLSQCAIGSSDRGGRPGEPCQPGGRRWPSQKYLLSPSFSQQSAKLHSGVTATFQACGSALTTNTAAANTIPYRTNKQDMQLHDSDSSLTPHISHLSAETLRQPSTLHHCSP